MRFVESVRAAIRAGSFVYESFFPDTHAAPAGHLAGETVEISLLRWFSQNKHRYKHSTQKMYASAIDAQLVPRIGHIDLGRLSHDDIAELIADMADDGRSGSWINNTLTPLRKIVKLALASGAITKDPMLHISNVKVRKPKIDPFTLNEMKAILNEIYETQALNFYTFAFWTGARTGELIALEWSDIDFDKRTMTIERSKTRRVMDTPKSDAGDRTVELNEPALEALKSQRRYTGLLGGEVFHNPLTGEPWKSDKSPRETHWQPALERAGVRYRPPHNCRHTYATVMISTGENPSWVSAQLGHENPAIMWKRYAKWMPQDDEGRGGTAAKLWKRTQRKRGNGNG